jgi:biopolymer transport protein ExbB
LISLRRMMLVAATLVGAQLLVTNAFAQVTVADFSKTPQQWKQQESKLAKEREARFNAELREQEKLARDALARRNTAEARGNSLNSQYDANIVRIAEMTQLLRQHEGNLGELFGVTRQIAGDAANVLQQSMLTVQYPAAKGEDDRVQFLVKLAGVKALPSIVELERMWFELQREMTENGKVVRFKTMVMQPQPAGADPVEPVEMEVVRVGPFTAVSDGKYLAYIPSKKALTMLERQVGGSLVNVAEDLQEPTEGSEYRGAIVDPARGALLTRYVERPNAIERIQNGEVVGYVIVFVGILGVVLALYQYFYLFVTRAAVNSQLRDTNNPKKGNPLGRVILAFRGDGKRAENSELAELRLSEAVLREIPKIERFQAFLRLAVAAGPLLGLIGTVIGMIITFHAIVASGSSDPRLMAHGIGQAMIATVLGLGIAIPLLFINSGLAALSGAITQILDEQSEVMLASDILERRRAA